MVTATSFWCPLPSSPFFTFNICKYNVGSVLRCTQQYHPHGKFRVRKRARFPPKLKKASQYTGELYLGMDSKDIHMCVGVGVPVTTGNSMAEHTRAPQFLFSKCTNIHTNNVERCSARCANSGGSSNVRSCPQACPLVPRRGCSKRSG